MKFLSPIRPSNSETTYTITGSKPAIVHELVGIERARKCGLHTAEVIEETPESLTLCLEEGESLETRLATATSCEREKLLMRCAEEIAAWQGAGPTPLIAQMSYPVREKLEEVRDVMRTARMVTADLLDEAIPALANVYGDGLHVPMRDASPRNVRVVSRGGELNLIHYAFGSVRYNANWMDDYVALVEHPLVPEELRDRVYSGAGIDVSSLEFMAACAVRVLRLWPRRYRAVCRGPQHYRMIYGRVSALWNDERARSYPERFLSVFRARDVRAAA